MARDLAELLDLPFRDDLQPGDPAVGHCYVVPDETLLPAEAMALGIAGDDDCFGGIVPHPFVATKCVSHGLIGPTASRPVGWVDALGGQLEGAVLPGYSAFSVDDAREALRQLMSRFGPVRFKVAAGVGGRGQSAHADVISAEAWLDEQAPEAVAASGLVVELNLDEEATWSIGTASVGGLDIAYYGTQHTTTDNAGRTVYGGSRLHLVRGGWDELIATAMPAAAREAALLARRFHEATFAAFPAMRASRCNYDVMAGRDTQGRRWSAVLEQSWRLGGASGAECAALLAFRDDPSRRAIVASTHERYGKGLTAPAGTRVHFHDDDAEAGPLLKYVEVDDEDPSRRGR